MSNSENEHVDPTAKPPGVNGNSTNGSGAIVPRKGDLLPGTPMAAGPGSFGNSPHHLDPIGLLRAFRRRWLLATSLGLALAACAGAGMWAVLTYVLPPKFTAYALLGVSATPRKVIFQTGESDTGTYSSLNTHALLIRSPFILATALRPPEIAQLETVRNQADPVSWLEKNIQVSFPAQGEVLRIAMSGEKPGDLAAIVNSVQKAYMEGVGNAEQEKRRLRLQQLQQIKLDLDNNIKSKKTLLKDMATAVGSGDPKTLNSKQQLAQQMHAQLQAELLRAETQLNRTRIEAVAAQTIGQPEEAIVPTETQVSDSLIDRYVDNDPRVKKLLVDKLQQQQLIEGRERAQSAAAKNNPPPSMLMQQKKLQDIEKAIDTMRAELRPEIAEQLAKETQNVKVDTASKSQREIVLLNEYVKELRVQWEEQSKAVEAIGRSSFDIEQLRSDIDDFDRMTSTISGEIAKLTVELQAPPRISTLQDAEAPKMEDLAARNKKVMMGAIAGFGLGLFVISFWEFRSRRVESPVEIENSLGLRIMGMLPDLPSSAFSGSSESAKKSFWMGMLSESIDAIRTTLLYDANKRSMRAVMVTSAVGHEGKTTLATHLATSLARAGRRTLLVDCDLRRPAVHLLFDMELQPGFAEVIDGSDDVERAIRPTHVADLYILPAGAMQRSVAEGLTNGSVGHLFERLKDEYDFVIVDSAPVLPVADSVIIGQHVDGVILSVLRGTSQMHRVYAAQNRLAMVGIQVIGAVVNRARGDVYGYGNYYHYPALGEARSTGASA